MKISLKTLKGEAIAIEVDPEATVPSLLHRFSQLKRKFMNKRRLEWKIKKLCLREKRQLIPIN